MRKISLLVATIAAAAALCAACGGSAPATGSATHRSSAGPRTASAGNSGAAASLSSGSVDACKLVPLAAVRAVLGDSFNSATSGSNTPNTAGYGVCVYNSSSTVEDVTISVFPITYSSALGGFISRKAPPFDGLGHLAKCGPGGPIAVPGQSDLLAALGSDGVVSVAGPSCSADGKLAQDVYSALAS